MRVIAGTARRINLKTPKGDNTRPTPDRIKETLFNIIQGDLYDCTFLDLFAGSGGIGIEALSRGAKKAVFVEKDHAALDCIKENLRVSKLFSRGEVIGTDAGRALSQLSLSSKGEFDIIFMDPPYTADYRIIMSQIADSGILAEDGYIIAEADIDKPVDFADERYFVIYRIKEYKSNKHIFISLKRDNNGE